MKELKVGMYIRYIPTQGNYTQKISKITKTKNCMLDMAYYLDNSEEPVFSSHFDDIVGVSEYIIDLIKIGDYVNGKEVAEILTDEHGDVTDIVYLEEVEGQAYSLQPIKNIVTKEQFENMKYIVEE